MGVNTSVSTQSADTAASVRSDMSSTQTAERAKVPKSQWLLQSIKEVIVQHSDGEGTQGPGTLTDELPNALRIFDSNDSNSNWQHHTIALLVDYSIVLNWCPLLIASCASLPELILTYFVIILFTFLLTCLLFSSDVADEH